ncbi:hypothetical protein DFH29DRAFT_803616 [Suillus ampliporus]|nr:hypothetical protein DFH29DRAFT_803616 [Suillus ampliporus]
MSENGEHSQTATLSEPTQSISDGVTDLTCVERCSELINQYRLGQNGKASTVLSIREILVDSPAVRSGRDINDALDVFIGMLDGIDSSKRTASEQAQQSEGRMPEEEAERENRGLRPSEERPVDVSKFPWMQRWTEALATLPSDIRETYEQLKNFAADPKSVVTNILSTPGCPPFPPSEWLNIVRWKYVDLGKVLDSAHTTELDPKKTHVIDDEIELALQVSKSSGGIKTSSDHNIAFSMYTEAIAFVFPQRRNEYIQYHTYLSWLFHAMEVRLHSRVIEFDRSVRNQVAMQRNLRLTNHSEFEHLRTTFLTSFGVGSNSTSSTSGSGGRTNRREGNSGRDDPCHKWNRGTCSKSDSECRFAHCCDRRGCRGAHRKSECPNKGTAK